jgi:hypothetical protein
MADRESEADGGRAAEGGGSKGGRCGGRMGRCIGMVMCRRKGKEGKQAGAGLGVLVQVNIVVAARVVEPQAAMCLEVLEQGGTLVELCRCRPFTSLVHGTAGSRRSTAAPLAGKASEYTTWCQLGFL